MGLYFVNFADFLAMSPYGAYIWSAYGIVILVSIILVVSSRIRLRRALNQMEKE